MERSRRLLLIAVGLTALVALAGCNGALTGGLGPSVSNGHVDINDNGAPVMEFDYATDEYATILLEGPDNEILNEKELSPENNNSSLHIENPRPGDYRLVLQQGGETQVTKPVSFDGPQAEITNVSANWSGNTVEGVHVTIQNSGDLPAGVVNASYSARGQSTDSSPINQWIAPNETTTVEATSSFANSVSVTEPGTVRGTIDVRTLNTTLTGSFQNTFQGANLTVTNITDYWDTNTLERAHVEVTNTGDLPTTANVSVDTTNDKFRLGGNKTIEPGETRVFERGGLFFNVETVRTGGEATFDVVVDSSTGHLTESFTHTVEGATVTLDSMTPIWEAGTLTTVEFSASNSGDLEADFTAEVTVNGQPVHETTGSLDATTSHDYEITGGMLTDGFYTVSDGGTYDVTLSLEGNNWNTSTTKTATFNGKTASISSVDATFIDNYDADTSDLSSLNFELKNTGDIAIAYDTIEITVDGSTATESNSYDSAIEPGESSPVYAYPDLSVANGQHDATIEVISGGEVVAKTTVTVST